MSKNADIKLLKEENEDLKIQIEKLVEKVDNLSQNVLSTKEASSANGGTGEQEEPLSSEKKKSVEFLSNQYNQVLKELDQIKTEIKEVSKKYTEVSNAIAAIEDYSFNYNVKIVGMPVVSEHERADETVEICLRLFAALDLKIQIEKLVEKVDNLSQNVLSTKEASSANGRTGEQEEPLSSEKKKSVEFLSNQYNQVLKELDQIKTEIKEVSKKYTEVSNAIAAIEDYSFNYNVKIVGMPVVSEHERADETVEICLRLFAALGVKDISPYDIDIAHRVPTTRNFPNKPNPIICKFTRRISKEKVMPARKNVFKISPTDVGFHEGTTL
ncbi:Hypothetical predicted protein [Paramuricea clavata]|uniref:Uncharacterized protein n=1 Tax=Paramuricea clavata TaxID=317549 RepID=A0A7D9HZ19_PARCT|nr:Hypothetical predicted protein [Paramuricea clavata]